MAKGTRYPSFVTRYTPGILTVSVIRRRVIYPPRLLSLGSNPVCG